MPITKRRKKIYTTAGELIRAPHSTPQTIVVHWDRIPVVYHGECNVAQCRAHSTMTAIKGAVQEWVSTHQHVFHAEFHHPKEKKA